MKTLWQQIENTGRTILALPQAIGTLIAMAYAQKVQNSMIRAFGDPSQLHD